MVNAPPSSTRAYGARIHPGLSYQEDGCAWMMFAPYGKKLHPFLQLDEQAHPHHLRLPGVGQQNDNKAPDSLAWHQAGSSHAVV